MRICPVEFDTCERESCASGYCELAPERALTPCLDCGALVVIGSFRICIDCRPVESPAEA
jgi:hypothetical protein